MIELKNVYETLKRAGVDFISGVPDTLLNDFCLGLDIHWNQEQHVLAAYEGYSIALTGLSLGYKYGAPCLWRTRAWVTLWSTHFSDR